MTDKATADEWQKRTDLTEQGVETRAYSSIHVDSGTETPKHLVVKALVARELQRRRGSNRWDTEVKVGEGRVDILDYGPPDEPPAIYEVETGLTRETKLSKIERYTKNTPIPETQVYFLDPLEAPDSIPELVEWVNTQVVA